MNPYPEDELAVELTPFIDMLFIVLLFFLLAGGASHLSVRVDLPAQNAAQVVTDKNYRQLEILPQGYALNGENAADIAALEALINGISDSDAPLMLISDKAVSVQRFLNVLELLHARGLQNVDVLARPE